MTYILEVTINKQTMYVSRNISGDSVYNYILSHDKDTAYRIESEDHYKDIRDIIAQVYPVSDMNFKKIIIDEV